MWTLLPLESEQESVRKETHAVSATMRASVENLRALLSCSKIEDNQRYKKFFEKKTAQRQQSIWKKASKTVQG